MPVPKLFYFCFYAAMAFFMPFLALYYAEIGLSGRQIGLLAGITPLVTLFAAPLWGGLADALQQHKRLLLAAIGMTLMAVLALTFTKNLLGLVLLVTLYGLGTAPIMPLVDHAVLEMLGAHKDQYGRLRLWGALGWGVAGVGAGWLVERAGLQWAFYGFLLLMGSGALVAARLPMRRTINRAKSFRQGMQTLLQEWQWIVLLVAVFASSVAMGLTNNFLFLYLNDLAASKTLMGISLLATTVSEIPVFFFAARLLNRWGARGLLIIALLAQALRMVAYAVMPAAWWVLPINLLHGLTFSAMWMAAVAYANAIGEAKGLGATAQGMLTAVVMGLAAAVGAVMGGLFYDTIGPAAMFGWAGAGVAIGLVFFIVAGRTPANVRLAQEQIAFGQE